MVKLLETSISNSNFEPQLLLGINRGGLIPSVFLSHALSIPMDTISIKTLDTCQLLPEQNLYVADYILEKLALGVRTIVVEDIVDTGATLNTLEILLKEKGINSDNIKHAALIARYNHGATKLDYYVKMIKNDNWLVFPYEKLD